MKPKNLHRKQLLSLLDSGYFLPALCVVGVAGVIAMLIYSFGA
jgi:hypothetical protein